jgi:protein SCO1
MSLRALAFVAVALLAQPVRAQRFWDAPPQAEPEPTILREVGIDQRLDQQLPLDTPFRDETGREVRLGEYFGKKPVILSLVYYECPMLCTLVLNGLASALDVLTFDVGKEFEIVTISFDPRDTPQLAAAKKQTYLQRYRRPGADAGWHFLTGDAASIERVTKAVGFRYAFDPEQQQFAHAAAIVVVTPEGRLARYFYGVEYPPRDLRFGLIEASEHKIGTPVDEVLLYCFHYDPKTGRYGAVVMNIVRLGGAVTLLGLGAFIFVMLRRDRQRQRRAVAAAGAPGSARAS